MTVGRNDKFLRAAAAVARAQDGMRPVFEIGRGLREATQPFADLQKQIAGIQAQFRKMQERDRTVFRAIQDQVRKMQEQDRAVLRAIQDQARFANAVARLNLGSVKAAAEQLAGQVRRAEAFDRAGWLPHPSTPLAQLEECVDDSQAIHGLLSEYYDAQWPEVRRDIETRLTAWRIDEEAKATFCEALDAHEAGFYRSVCRLLFPEIERVARRELHDDRMSRITSQKTLRSLAGRLPISAMEPGGFLGLNLFDRLSNHVYEDASDEEARQRLVGNPIPNRHAALHGLVVYSTRQNSLNVIFIADYVFELISVLKELQHSARTNERENGRDAGATGVQEVRGGSAASITGPKCRAL